jgi:tripartite-type tricarboxylate transporter receptor subunit TctC
VTRSRDRQVAAVPLIKSGKVRALAQPKGRSAHLPDVPTFTEAAFPNRRDRDVGLLAPAGFPRLVAKLNDALVRAVNDPSLRESLLAQGITPDPGSAQQFGAVLASETDRCSRLIDEAKIQP